MTNIYKCAYPFSTYLNNLRGASVLVEFKDAENTYITSDPVIQSGIEQHALFGSHIIKLESPEWLIQESGDTPSPVIKGDMKMFRQIESVKTLAQAKDYFRRIGVPAKEITSTARALEIAHEMSINFPNIIL